MAFAIYKPGQGKYTRLSSACATALIVGLGCWRLYSILQGRDMGDWIEIFVPAGLFFLFCLLIFWVVNKPAVANFMVAAEGEMKKVSWSSRREIFVSTIIVIVVVLVMAVLLGVTDFIFKLIFMTLLE